MNSPLLSIIIPTSKGKFPARLLNSIKEQSLDSNLFETLLIFNKKKAPAPDPQWAVTICFSQPYGVNRARNQGVSRARGEYLLFLDDDCELPSADYLQKLVELHKKHPQQVSLGGPYTLPPTASPLDHSYYEISQQWLQRNFLDSTHTTVLLGGNSSYKKKIFQDDITFPPQIKYGGSETPLNALVLKKYGPHLWEADLAVLHYSQLTLWTFLKKAFWQGRGAGYMHQQYGHNHSPYKKSVKYDQRSLDTKCIYECLFFVGYHSYLHSWARVPLLLLKDFFPIDKVPLIGFIKSLFILPQEAQQLPWPRKSLLWFYLFLRKWAWLALKSVGLR